MEEVRLETKKAARRLCSCPGNKEESLQEESGDVGLETVWNGNTFWREMARTGIHSKESRKILRWNKPILLDGTLKVSHELGIF